MKKIVFVLMFILLAGFATAASNVDFVYDSVGNSHVTFEDSGSIYYSYDDGAPELVATGTDPAIDVDSNNAPHIAFVNSAVQYSYKDVDGFWTTPMAIGGDRTPDISIDPSDKVYIIFKSGGNSGTVQLAQGPSFTVSNIASGNYETNYYVYYWEPKIQATADGYIMVMQHYYNYGYGSRGYYAIVRDQDGLSKHSPSTTDNTYYGQNPLTIIGDDVYLSYARGGNVYVASTDFSSWSESLMAAGNYPTIDSDGSNYAVSYSVSSSVKYIESADLTTEKTVADGSAPTIRLDATCVYYINGSSAVASSCSVVEDSCTDEDGDLVCVEDGDCDDSDKSAYPGATEVWYDGVDQDCDGLSDYDADKDGYDAKTYDGNDCDDKDETVTTECDDVVACTDEDDDGYCVEDDCNDNNPDSHETFWVYVDEDHDGFHKFGPANYNNDPESEHYQMLLACVSSWESFSLKTEGPDYCDDNMNAHTEIDCGFDDQPVDVPEFGLIGGILAVAGIGLLIFRKRK